MSGEVILRIIMAIFFVLILGIYIFTGNSDYIQLMIYILLALTIIYQAKYKKKDDKRDKDDL